MKRGVRGLVLSLLSSSSSTLSWEGGEENRGGDNGGWATLTISMVVDMIAVGSRSWRRK